MSNFWLFLLIAILMVFLSLSGGFLLLHNSKTVQKFQKYLTAFAALIMVFVAFFDIIPEIVEVGTLPIPEMIFLIVAGTLLCFFVSFIAKHFHSHGEEISFHNKKQAYMMLTVDSLHTIVDGIVLGLAFAASFGTGILAAVATVAHEIPQEIGDFSIMIRSKMSKKRILKLQILSGLLLVPAAILAYFVGDALFANMSKFLSLIAGFFIYIALGEIYSIIRTTRKK